MIVVSLPVPPSVMPALEVEPDTVEDCGVQLRAACARLDDLGTFAAAPAQVDDWWGVSADAYRSRTATIRRGADAMSLALRRVAARVLEHAEALARLRVRHDDLVTTSVSLAGGIEVLRHDIAVATPTHIDQLAAVLQARSDAVAAHITAYEADRVRWVRDLAWEEREMVAAFERLLTLHAVERLFAGRPDPADEALSTLPPPDAAPAQVLDWWQGLRPGQRRALLVAAPGAIGNLGGIPALARHRANLVRLQRDLATLGSRREAGHLTDDERLSLRNAEAAAGAYERVRGLVDPRTGEPVPVRLYLYDPSAFGGDGAVAVAVGDPDAADDVSVLVPGMGTDAAGIGGVTTAAIAVYRAARVVDGDASHAALAWVGYDAPDNIPVFDGLSGDVAGVVDEGMADRGGERLAAAVEQLRGERSGPPADLTVIGHSYGSTTLGQAAHDEGLAADDVVIVGSPGLGVEVHDTSDLGLAPDQVWVGANSHDLVADSAGNGFLQVRDLVGAGLGDDPAADDFGAVRFQAESSSRGWLDGFGDHTRYFDPDTESLHNIAEIVTGHDTDVRRAEPIADPWWGPARDPERHRDPTTPATGMP